MEKRKEKKNEDIIGGLGIEFELGIGSIGGSGVVAVLMSELRWRRCKNSIFHFIHKNNKESELIEVTHLVCS